MALSWLVFRLSNSAFMLGVVEFANLLPTLLFGLMGGLIADKFNRKTILIITQSVAMLQAIVLACLTLFGIIKIWELILLSFILGLVSAFEIPSRQAMIVNLVDRKDLVNAISLNSTLFNSARSIGPAIAAVIVSYTNEGFCFVVNAISFIAALISLFFLKLDLNNIPQSHLANYSFKLARDFVMSNQTMKIILLTGGIISFFGLTYSVLLPVYASNLFNGNAASYASLRALAGVGAFIAALSLANRGDKQSLVKYIGLAALFFGISLYIFSRAHKFLYAQFIIIFVGFCMTTFLSGAHSLVQLVVTDNVRGRVMSIYSTTMLGIAPLGSLAIGYFAKIYGVREALSLSALMSLIAGIFYFLAWYIVKRNIKKIKD